MNQDSSKNDHRSRRCRHKWLRFGISWHGDHSFDMPMMSSNTLPAHRQHDLSDRVWLLLEPHLPGRRGVWEEVAKDNRLFINAVFWILRTGAPWRDLPPDYGDWKNIHRRFCRWRDKNVWAQRLEILITEPDYEWLMMDATHAKVHPDAAGACGGNQAMGVTKGGSTASFI